MMQGLAGRLAANYRFLVLWASMLLLLVGTGGMYLLAVALKPIALDFDWPRSVPSLASSAQFIGSGFGAIVMGWWMDRAGIGRPVLLGSVMLGLGAIIVANMDTEWEMLVAYGVFMGFLGQATLFSPLMANIVTLFERRRGFAAGIVGSGQAFAGAVWPPVAGYFITAVGWRQTYLLFGIFAICTMLPLALVLIGQRRFIGETGWLVRPASGGAAQAPSAGAAEQSDGGLSSRAWMVALSVAIIGCCVSMALPIFHLVSYTTDLGFSAVRASEMLAVALLAAAIARLAIMGPLSSRIGSLPALFAFSVVQASMVAALIAVDHIAAFYLVAFLFGIGYGGLLPLYPVVIRDHLSAHGIGRRTAQVILFGGMGMALGGWTGGFFYDLTGGYAAAFGVGVAANVMNLVIIGFLILRTRGPRAAPASA